MPPLPMAAGRPAHKRDGHGTRSIILTRTPGVLVPASFQGICCGASLLALSTFGSLPSLRIREGIDLSVRILKMRRRSSTTAACSSSRLSTISVMRRKSVFIRSSRILVSVSHITSWDATMRAARSLLGAPDGTVATRALRDPFLGESTHEKTFPLLQFIPRLAHWADRLSVHPASRAYTLRRHRVAQDSYGL